MQGNVLKFSKTTKILQNKAVGSGIHLGYVIIKSQKFSIDPKTTLKSKGVQIGCFIESRDTSATAFISDRMKEALIKLETAFRLEKTTSILCMLYA